MTRSLLFAAGLAATAVAVPAANTQGAITNPSQLSQAVSGVNKATGTAYFASYSALYATIKPSAAPTNSADAASRISAAYAAYPSNPNAVGAALLLNGVAGPSVQSIVYSTLPLLHSQPYFRASV